MLIELQKTEDSLADSEEVYEMVKLYDIKSMDLEILLKGQLSG